MVAVVLLALVWGTAFAVEVVPFFTLVVAGGVVTGLVGVWVRRGSRGWHPGEPEPRRFPPYRVTPPQVLLAVAVGVAHLVVGHALFALGRRLLPTLTENAAAVYDRADALPLWAAVLLGGILTGALEEIFWRGAVQPLVVPWVRERVPWTVRVPLGPVVATTAVYALFHVVTLQVALVAAAALGGLVWGWLLERTGSLGAVMVAHATWTSLMLVVPPV